MSFPNTANWTLSAFGDEGIKTDLDDVAQCIYVILTTKRGSDPLRPTFGTEIWKWIDQPVTLAIPNVIREIYEGVEIWEKRAKIVSIVADTTSVSAGNVLFKITWQFILSGTAQTLDFYLNGTK